VEGRFFFGFCVTSVGLVVGLPVGDFIFERGKGMPVQKLSQYKKSVSWDIPVQNLQSVGMHVQPVRTF
jgi:hypothetical protein